MHHVFELDDVLMKVEFEHKEGMPHFHSVRVLDEAYRPVGPNLARLLDKVFLLTSPAEGERFLSVVAGELT